MERYRRELADVVPTASFDAALCRFGLMFLSDLAGALRRTLALLVPGGRLAAAVWGPPARCPALSVPLAAIGQYVEAPSVPPGTPGLFGLGGEGVIEDELAFAGFEDVRSCRLGVTFEWTSPEQFARFHHAVAAPMWGTSANRPTQHQAELLEALTAAARARAGTSGRVWLEAEVVVAAGQRRRSEDPRGGPVTSSSSREGGDQ